MRTQQQAQGHTISISTPWQDAAAWRMAVVALALIAPRSSQCPGQSLQPDLICYSANVRACAQSGMRLHSEELIREMHNGTKAEDVLSYPERRPWDPDRTSSVRASFVVETGKATGMAKWLQTRLLLLLLLL